MGVGVGVGGMSKAGFSVSISVREEERPCSGSNRRNGDPHLWSDVCADEATRARDGRSMPPPTGQSAPDCDGGLRDACPATKRLEGVDIMPRTPVAGA